MNSRDERRAAVGGVNPKEFRHLLAVADFKMPNGGVNWPEANRFMRACGTGEVDEWRIKLIRYLRAMPYDEFLKTSYWRDVRTAVADRDGRQCVRCGAFKAFHIHHKTYEHHGSEYDHLEGLCVLCEDCHEEVSRGANLEWYQPRDGALASGQHEAPQDATAHPKALDPRTQAQPTVKEIL